jgi:hypothetical protein
MSKMNVTLNAYAESIVNLETQARNQEANGQKQPAEITRAAIVTDCEAALKLRGLAKSDIEWLEAKMKAASK